MPEPRRWDVQISVHGDADIRAHVNAAITTLITQLTDLDIQCTATAFNAEGNAYNQWDNDTQVQPAQDAAAPGYDGPTPNYTDPRWLTANGEPIVPGLRVWDNDLRQGTVDFAQTFRHYNPDRPWDGWFAVLVDETGSHDLADGSRMTTVHPFTRAEPDPL